MLMNCLYTPPQLPTIPIPSVSFLITLLAEVFEWASRQFVYTNIAPQILHPKLTQLGMLSHSLRTTTSFLPIWSQNNGVGMEQKGWLIIAQNHCSLSLIDSFLPSLSWYLVLPHSFTIQVWTVSLISWILLQWRIYWDSNNHVHRLVFTYESLRYRQILLGWRRWRGRSNNGQDGTK